MKKTLVLAVLFILPLVAYLFFASGVNNFGRLPVVTEQLTDLDKWGKQPIFKDRITVLCFLGEEVQQKKGMVFNLNQKIYKRFHEFHDFQFVILANKGTENQMESIKEELGKLMDLHAWKVYYLDADTIQNIFNGLGTDLQMNGQASSDFAFIIDKESKLRGRTDDEDEGLKYGYNANSVAELTNKMIDDVKIILAEYRFALKKNNEPVEQQ